MDISNTSFYKGRDGWNAKDAIDMGASVDHMGRPAARKLQIHTYKSSRGGIFTQATCAQHSGGMMTFEIFGDFSKVVAKQDCKCTEKSVKTLHATVMLGAESILAEAREFYRVKDEKAQLHAKREAELAAQDAEPVERRLRDSQESGTAGLC